MHSANYAQHQIKQHYTIEHKRDRYDNKKLEKKIKGERIKSILRDSGFEIGAYSPDLLWILRWIV